MINIQNANAYLNSTLYKKKWSTYEEEDKELAINTALDTLKDIGWLSSFFNGEVPIELEQAVYIQAYFLLGDLDREDYEVAEKNGIANLDGISKSPVEELYPAVYRKVKHFLYLGVSLI